MGMKRLLVFLIFSVFVFLISSTTEATVISTNTASEVTNFQSGATVNTFEAILNRTPQNLTSYPVTAPGDPGIPVSPLAFIFNEIPGVQFSVGGTPGTNEPALYSLSGNIAGDAKSPTTVLGPVDFDFTSKFNSGALIEIFFPTKVSKVGFWLNPSLGNALLIAANTNFAFSGLTETTLESGNGAAGNFVGIERGTADIGGFKVIALGTTGFTIDDFTFGGAGAPPPNGVSEPATMILLGSGLVGLIGFRRVLRK
jgi:PEP-CTERM motif